MSAQISGAVPSVVKAEVPVVQGATPEPHRSHLSFVSGSVGQNFGTNRKSPCTSRSRQQKRCTLAGSALRLHLHEY